MIREIGAIGQVHAENGDVIAEVRRLFYLRTLNLPLTLIISVVLILPCMSLFKFFALHYIFSIPIFFNLS